MLDPIQIQSSAGATKSAATSQGASPAGPAAAGIAFQALLERLEGHARELEAQTQNIGDSKELAGAVDRAHASLQDALSLSDRLVEAYRAALARPKAASTPAADAGAKSARAVQPRGGA